jgi:hypothetical protein
MADCTAKVCKKRKELGAVGMFMPYGTGFLGIPRALQKSLAAQVYGGEVPDLDDAVMRQIRQLSERI